MPRRSDHTRSEIREMIIEAGQQIIKESGVLELSTRKIASKIGYTVGTLYHFFDNYDDIILHINSVTLSDLKNNLKESVSNKALNANSKIKQLAETYIKFSSEDSHRWRTLFEYQLINSAELPKWYKEKIDSLFEFFEAPISNIIKDKALAKKHAKILWSSVHGVCSLGLTDKIHLVVGESVKSLTDSLIDSYLGAIASNKNQENDLAQDNIKISNIG